MMNQLFDGEFFCIQRLSNNDDDDDDDGDDDDGL